MKTPSTFNKLTAVAFGLMLFASCSKTEDAGLSNITSERKDNAQALTMNEMVISSDLILQDRVNGVDYIISNNVQVNANLTIQPGVTIQFADGAGLQVNEEGSLTAVGANGNIIYFTSKSGKRSTWKGITVLSNGGKNMLSYCKIEHGGGTNSFGSANVIVGSGTNAGAIEITNSEITASGSNGILVSEGSKLVGFVGNNIHTNSEFPVSMHITDAMSMDNANQYSKNGKEFVQLTGNASSVITKDIMLVKTLEPFLISGKIVAGNKFCIAAGSRVSMDYAAEVVIDGVAGNGSFCAVGTSAQPIFISSIFNGTGIWNTIRFRSSNSSNNKIEYCTISGGGSNQGNNDGMVSVVNDNGGSTNIVVRNSNIINSAGTGIFIQNTNSAYNNDIISANTFSNNVKGNVHFE